MFIILYGLTGTVGHKVRAHFGANGFKKMEKIYYSDLEEDVKRLQADGCQTVSDPGIILQSCDYSCRSNHRLQGFNKKDFINAASGAEDVFTSFACTDIAFLKALKADCGDYVTLIYVYYDDATLEETTRFYPESERKERLETGRMLKNIYMENHAFFDNVVLYGGEHSVFNEENLYLQLDNIVERARSREVKLLSKRKVALPYAGTEDFIFVSYSHRDKERVMKKLHVLQRNGFRLWYDSGMTAGDNWRRVLREKIKLSQNVIVFTSSDSIGSEDVKIEIVTADAFERKIINICLDNVSFDGTVGMIMRELHAVSADAEDFEEQMIAALDESTRAPEQATEK